MKYYTKEEVLKEIKRHAVECMNGDEFTPMMDVLRYLSNRYKIPVPTLKKYFYPSKVFNPTGINSQLLKATGFEAVYLKTDREERDTQEEVLPKIPRKTKETARKQTPEHKGENKKHAESQEKKEKILLAFKEFLESVS